MLQLWTTTMSSRAPSAGETGSVRSMVSMGGSTEPPAAALIQGLHLSLCLLQSTHCIHHGAGNVPEGDITISGCAAQEVPPGSEVLESLYPQPRRSPP